MFKKTEHISFLIGFLISIVALLLSHAFLSFKDTPILQRKKNVFLESLEILDLRFNDFKYKLQSPTKSPAPVAMIAIDDASVREIGRWPWGRDQIAQLTEKLISLGAQTISFDVSFAEPDKTHPEADQAFGNLIEKYPNKIILGVFSENKVHFQPYQDLCVAEAFIATGGDQTVKLNPTFTMDEPLDAFDEINWGPHFKTLFSNIQNQEKEKVLLYLGKTSDSPLTPYQENFLKSRMTQSLFEYCHLWLTDEDPFLQKDLKTKVEPLYLDLIKNSKELHSLSFDKFIQKIKISFKPHPIPQYGEWTPNIPALQTPASYSASFIAELDTDGYVRRYPLFFRSGNKLGSSFIPSLALQSFLLSGSYRAEISMSKDENGFKSINNFKVFDTSKDPEVEHVKLPLDKAGQMLIRFYGRQMSLPYVSAKELFHDRPTIKVQFNALDTDNRQLLIIEKELNKADFFKGRSLVVGATAIGLYDLRNTPIEANYPGPELHLTMLANLLDRSFISPWGQEGIIGPWVLFFLSVLLSLSLAWLGSIYSVVAFLAIILILALIDIWLFTSAHILVHTLLLYLIFFAVFSSIQVFKYFTEEKKKRELKSTFSKYVSPAVVDELLKDAKNLQLGGRRQRMTAFFSDVRGFTTISEKLPPEELSRVLNLYLTPMTEIVFKNSGTLDKYMGDAIMAFFGAPVNDAYHAEHACRCALQSIEKLHELQEMFKQRNLPVIDIGIGVNTGDMSVGNMGSTIVQNYTIMGDAVNLASRLEGINKEYGTRIIVSEFTAAEVEDKFTLREIDRVRVKGKNEPVRIYELLAEGPPAKFKNRDALQIFQESYSLYQNKEFIKALEGFKKVPNLFHIDTVAEIYIERCRSYITNPPPSDWDGVYNMKTK